MTVHNVFALGHMVFSRHPIQDMNCEMPLTFLS